MSIAFVALLVVLLVELYLLAIRPDAHFSVLQTGPRRRELPLSVLVGALFLVGGILAALLQLEPVAVGLFAVGVVAAPAIGRWDGTRHRRNPGSASRHDQVG